MNKEEKRGIGTSENPHRIVPQLWTEDGILVAYKDISANTSMVEQHGWKVYPKVTELEDFFNAHIVVVQKEGLKEDL